MRLEYFDLIDTLLGIDSSSASFACTLPEHSTVFEGHFPGYPILPGVLMIELIAQAGGFLSYSINKGKNMSVFLQCNSFKFRRQIVPGTALKVVVRMLHQGSGYSVIGGELFASEELAASGEIKLKHISFPNQHTEQHMKRKANAIGITEYS